MPDHSNRSTETELPAGLLEGGDLHRFKAILGWLELGNPEEAIEELKGMSSLTAAQPLMLELAYQVHAARKDWAEALKVALKLKELLPDRPEAWLHLSYAMRRAPGGGVLRAQEALSPALEKFPDEATIPYNLACYACVLGEHASVFPLLERAMRAGGKQRILSMALADKDFEPLWKDFEVRWLG